MLFNSLDFAFFLPLVFLIYWSLKNYPIKYQNFVLLIASYIFYGWWDYRFLSLLIFSTLLDYSVGLLLYKSNNLKLKKQLLIISVTFNIGFLGLFKYYNFFINNFIEAFLFFGKPIEINTLHIILPVGISFYTFQTLTYTLDIYKGKLKPCENIISFATFVSFFPQLVAGPIERATNLLPQFYVKRKFKYNVAVDGMRQLLWGLFKKIVIADNCASYANMIFDNYESHSGIELVFGAFFFTLQIYGDFSGYSDIAIGVSRLFGFDLKKNFAFPYFSRDIAEFWRRWHISLSTWFRDYLYIPLGGSKGGTMMKIRNTFVIFLVSGFWHGANWTFIIWGALNAIYFLPLLLTNKNRIHQNTVAKGKYLPSFKEFTSILITFILTVFAWIFFRSKTVFDAFKYIKGIFSNSLFSVPNFNSNYISTKVILLLIILFFAVEWFQRDKNHGLEISNVRVHKTLRWLYYFSIGFAIIYFGAEEQEFIYFQF